MSAWTPLSDAEDPWGSVIARFQFKPSVDPKSWPGFSPPSPFVTWSVPDPFSAAETEDLHRCALSAFRRVLRDGERMFALDWQHAGFWFQPHVAEASWGQPDRLQRGLLPDEPARTEDRWMIPVLPNGDYVFFVSSGLDWGWFGHPWEQSICVFGEPLLAAVEARPPALLRAVRRSRRAHRPPR
jgi:hypothetical protein